MIRLNELTGYTRFYQQAFEYLYSSGIQARLKEMQTYHVHTYEHMLRVGFLSGFIAYLAKAKEKEIVETTIAGLLHDIGKLNTPIGILDKPGRLTDDEFTAIKRHPLDGYDITAQYISNTTILDAILQHHEVCDGTGYYGMSDILKESERIRICDIYDALTEERCYRRKLNDAEAKDIMSRVPHLDIAEMLDLEKAKELDNIWKGLLYTELQK